MADSMRRFERDYAIRFSHCDPAGIVFFPQYLVLFNHLVEDWFNEGLGIAYGSVINERGIGIPIVHLECDFCAMSRMGDVVTFGLEVARLGGKSLTLDLDACCGKSKRVVSRQVLVFTDKSTRKSTDVPTDIRSAIDS